MQLKNARIGGKLKNITVSDGVIQSVTDAGADHGLDAGGMRVIPGLIDLHTHGYMGIETSDIDFAPLCRFYAEHGTTAWLPTTLTEPIDTLLRTTKSETRFPGAEILGFHLEGPYISARHKGAQDERNIRMPSVEEFSLFSNVRMITIAPELPGGEDFIRAVSPGCVVSIGHTDCDYETALRAIECGANCLTHTYNAMPPLHHRNPGPIGAAFEKHIYAQLICDGFHISKPVVLATYRMFGPDRVVFISDSIRCAGLPEGEYQSGGLPVFVKDGAIRLADGTIAGSGATLWDCVKTAVTFGIPFDDAVRMASQTPAELLGVKKGRIAPGFDADLLIIDDRMEIDTVIIRGEVFYRRSR